MSIVSREGFPTSAVALGPACASAHFWWKPQQFFIRSGSLPVVFAVGGLASVFLVLGSLLQRELARAWVAEVRRIVKSDQS